MPGRVTGRLALVTALQVTQNLADRQAAQMAAKDAVRRVPSSRHVQAHMGTLFGDDPARGGRSAPARELPGCVNGAIDCVSAGA